jgi:hypothetical protein
MYMVEELVDIPLGGHLVGRQFIRDAFELMRDQPGFCNGQIAAYCGNIRQHMILSFWQDADAYESWLNSAQAKELGKAKTPYRARPGPGKFWELFLETPGPEQGNFLNQGILQVRDLDRWDAFMEQRREHDASAKAAGGLVYVQAYRYVGETDGKYFTPATTAILVRRKDRAAYENSVELGARKEASHAEPAYRTVSPQLPDRAGLYDIIHDVKP